MAKKRDPFKQDYNTNDEWDLGGAFEDFDSAYDNINVTQTKPKGRKPLEDTGAYVTPVLKGASFNAVTALKNTLLRKMPKTKALADDASGFMTELDSVRRELLGSASPMVNSLKQAARVLGPKFERMAPQQLNKAIKDFSKEEQQYRAPSKEEVRDRAVSDAVSKALKLQIEQASTTAEEGRFNTILDRKISEKRHKGSIDIQKNILRELQYKTEFMKTTTIGYYTKSLEIGMQQLYINKDILATLQLTAKVVEEGMKGLLHNSMLPDIQKQRMTESWKEITRGALIQKANSKMKSLLGLGTRFAKNLGNKVKDSIGNASSTIEMGTSGVEMMDSMDEMESSMGGNRKKGPGTLGKQGLELGGAAGSEFAMWLLRKYNPKLLKTINNKILKPITRGPESLISNLQNRANLTLKEADRNREYGGIKNGLKNFFLDVLDLKGIEKDKVTNTFSKSPTDVTSFDIATRASIVEIIPGYLAKILQQVTIANGKQAEELVYDDRTRDFISSSKYVSSKMDIMHGERSKRRGSHFAKGAASLVAGNRYHSASKEENEKSIATFKDVRKDIETVMRNHAVEELLFRPEHIKEYADLADPSSKLSDVNNIIYDYNKANYIKLAFTGVSNPAIVAKFLAKAMYDRSGVINIEVKNEFEAAIYDLMGDDNYKDQLPDIVNSFGTGRFFKNHFDASASKKQGGDLVLDKDSIIKNYQQNYNVSAYDKSLYGNDAAIGNKLNSEGTSIREMMEILPPSLREFVESKISPDRLDKRMFEKTRYNDLGAQRINISHSNAEDHIEGSTLEDGIPRKRGGRTTINNSMPSKIEVIKTSGDHVLTIPINNIGDKIDEYMTNIRDKQPDNTTTPFNNNDAQSTLLVIADHLASMREENKALVMAGMVSSAPGADPKKVQGVWKSIGKLGVSGIKGTGRFIGGSFKFHTNMATSIASGVLKTTAAVLPSIINASGMAIGGGLKGAGSLAGSLITANKELFMGMSRGVGATLGAGVIGLGKLFGKSWGKGRDTSGRMSSFIKDIYTPTSENPVIRARDFLDGVYTRTKDGSMKLIHSASEIAGEVYNQKGDMLLSAQDAAQGLFDRAGKQLDFSSLKDGINNQKDSLLKSGLVGAGKGLWKGAKGILSNSLMLPGSLTNKIAGLGLKGLGWAGGQLGKLGGKIFGSKKGSEDITQSFIRSSVSDKLDTIIKYIKPKDDVFGDIDGDGTREGSYKDYIAKKQTSSTKKTSDKDMPPWMAGLLKKDKATANGDGGILGTLFSFFGGGKLLDKFNALKSKLVGRLFGAVKGMTGLLGKGLAGLLGVFFGKGAMGSMMGGLGGLLGKAAGGAKALAGATAAGGGAALSFLGGATKAGAKGMGAIAAGAVGKVGAILAKAKSLIPDKLLKFFKIDKIAPMVAKKLGPKTIGTLAAKLLGGPFMWLVAGGLIVKAAATGAYDAVEILGLPEGTDIDVSDRLKVSLAAAVCEGIFAGLIETKWFATSILGVTPGKYLKGIDDANRDQNKPTSADAAVTEKVAAVEKADQATKAATENARATAATDKILQAAGVSSGASVGVTGANGSKTNVSVPGSDVGSNINFDNIKPTSVGDGTNQLGEFVKRFESGNKGSSTVAWDKHGGTSYGTYQLSSRAGSLKEFIEYCEKDGGAQGKEVAKLMRQVRDWNPGRNYKGTMAHRVWTELASKGAVQGLEHAYVQKKLYGPALKRLPADLQQQVSSNRGLQEMLWSMSVQHGSAGAAKIWNKYWQPGMPIDQFVKTVYANRGNYFSSSTPDVQKSVRNRFKEEVGVILGLLGRGAISEESGVTDTSSSNADTGNSMGMAIDNHNETMQKHTGVGAPTGVPSAYGSSASGGGMPGGTVGGTTGEATGTASNDVGENISKLEQMGVQSFTTLGGGGMTSVSKVDPDLLKRFTAAAGEFTSSGGKLSITSAFRTMADQQSLSGTAGAARAGRSPHQRGAAFDIGDAHGGGVKGRGFGTGTVADAFEPIAAKYGLHRPYRKRNEEQHFEVKKGAPDLRTPEAAGVDGGEGPNAEAPADATTKQVAENLVPGTAGTSTDTQKTGTYSGTTTVPVGGGAGSVASQVDHESSSTTQGDGGYRQPYSPANATTVLQPIIDIITVMSDRMLTIADNTGHLDGIKQLIATQSGASIPPSASASPLPSAPQQSSSQAQATPPKQAMIPVHAPISTSASTRGVRPLT